MSPRIDAKSAARATTPQATTTDGAATPGVANFEQSLQQLEALVAQLETGDLPLDAALATFERGVRLTRECQSALTAAQQKVQLLQQRGESVSIDDFELNTAGEPRHGD